MKLAEDIAAHIIKHQKARPMLVAFDGVDAAGKTALADNVADCLRNRDGLTPVRISLDAFHHPREIRLSRGALSPEGYFHDSFNLERLRACVIRPVKNKAPALVCGIFDYRRERELEPRILPVTDDIVVLFDGVFLHRDELFEAWDLSFFLDVTFETVRKRAKERHGGDFGSEEEIMERYARRYIPGQKLYLARCKPRERADFVIDNNDWEKPRLTKGRFA
jgi:uridine kinase